MRCVYARSGFRAEGLGFRISEMGAFGVCKDMWGGSRGSSRRNMSSFLSSKPSTIHPMPGVC